MLFFSRREGIAISADGLVRDVEYPAVTANTQFDGLARKPSRFAAPLRDVHLLSGPFMWATADGRNAYRVERLIMPRSAFL
jgi:hypothetical protein